MFTPTRALCGRSTADRVITRRLAEARSRKPSPATAPPAFLRQQQQQQPKPAESNTKWLDAIEVKMKALRGQDLKPKAAGKLGKRLRRIEEHRLELLTGRDGFLSDAKARGLDKQPVAWGEMHGHVNNIQYNRWAEAGRVNWLLDFATRAESQYKEEWRTLLTPRGLGVILKSIKTEYKFPVSYPDEISVIHKLTTQVTPTSDRFLLEGLIFSERHKRIAARTTEEIVVYDYVAGEKAALRPFMVKAMAHMYELQERRRAGVEAERKEMEEDIEEVEVLLRVRRHNEKMEEERERR